MGFFGPNPLLPSAAHGRGESRTASRPGGCGDAAELPVQPRAESTLSWDRREGDHFSLGLPGGEEGWPSPNTHPLLRKLKTSAEDKHHPANPLVSCCQQRLCPKRWGLTPFCGSCLPQELGLGTAAAAGGKTPHRSTPSQSPRASCASQGVRACLLPAWSRARQGERGRREPDKEKDSLTQH